MYLMFAFDHCYPGGGVNDFLGEFETIAFAQQHAAARNVQQGEGYENYQIGFLREGKIHVVREGLALRGTTPPRMTWWTVEKEYGR